MHFKLLLSSFFIILFQFQSAIGQETVQSSASLNEKNEMVENLERLKDKFRLQYQPYLNSENPTNKELEDPLFWRSCSSKIWKQKNYKLANELYLDSKKVIKFSGKDETVFFATKEEEGGQWFNLQIETIKQLRKEGLSDQEITNKLGQGSDSYISYLNHIIKPEEKKQQTIVFIALAVAVLISIIVLLKCAPKNT